MRTKGMEAPFLHSISQLKVEQISLMPVHYEDVH